MSIISQSNPLYQVLVDVFGIKIKDEIAIDKRIRQVTAVTIIGTVFGLLFAFFNLATPHMELLSVVEFMAVFLLVPAGVPGRFPAWLNFAEALAMIANIFFSMALVGFGGIEGTDLFWVYTAPFLAFFLKGQRMGWRYSVALLVIMMLYFIIADHLPAYFYHHSSVVTVQFIISLGFYTLIAAAFNYLRSRFEDQLQKQVAIKTSDSQKLLNQLQFLATHDRLTQLPNRVLLTDIIQQQINAINSPDQLLIICILKLERMVEMSNILGSTGADQLVLKIAEHLGQFVGSKGALAQTHRDEFVVSYRVSRGIFKEEGLQHFVAERQISVEVLGYVIYCEFTFGLAIYPDHAAEPQLLLNKAQQAVL